jgi:hypothetical protein
MPMLPSGRQVGLSAKPLVELLDHAGHANNAPKVMALRAWDDLYPWLEVLFFLPAGSLGNLAPSQRADASLPAPPGLIAVHSGYRLADWQAGAAGWSEADRSAMAKFLDGRAREHFALYLEQIRSVQQKVKTATGAAVVQLFGEQESSGAARAEGEGEGEDGNKSTPKGSDAEPPDRD